VRTLIDANKQRKSRVCGACLQYIHDFAIDPKTKIVMAKSPDGKVLFDIVDVKTLKELFPSRYKSENCRKT
jgi:cytidine deaminase